MNKLEAIPIWKNVIEEEKRIRQVEDRENSKLEDLSVSAVRGGYYLSGKQVVTIWCLCLALSALMFVVGWISRGIVSDWPSEYAERRPLPENSDANYDTVNSLDGAFLSPGPRRVLLDKFLFMEVPLRGITSGYGPEKSSFTILSDGFWRKRDPNDELIVSIPESEYKIPENKPVRILVDTFSDKGDALDLAKRLNRRGNDTTVFRMTDSEQRTWFVIAVDNAIGDSIPADAVERFMADEDLQAFAAVLPANNLQTVSLAEDKDKIQTPRTNISRPYTLRLAAYRKHANAKTGLAIFKSRGLSLLMVGEIISKKRKKWLYVYSGTYETREAAAHAQKNNTRLRGSVITKVPYSILIKAPASENESETIAKLEMNGFFAHLLEDSGKTRKLMTGAFSSKSEAEAAKNRLAEKSLKCEIVER